jgi:hypothetical protein
MKTETVPITCPDCGNTIVLSIITLRMRFMGIELKIYIAVGQSKETISRTKRATKYITNPRYKTGQQEGLTMVN